MIRSRWAAVGAAVAVTLGAGGVSLTQAAISSGEKPVFVSLDAPCRVVDTRSGSPIGAGDAAALAVQITGANGACTGALAIPADAVGVATNVTVIQPNGAASGRSYFTVYPNGATRPITSNLNFVNGQAPTPNKVDVGIGTSGQIIIYNNEGTAHAAVDIFGYYIDHNHDDRYYTEGEVDTALGAKANAADVTAALATKANAADVYTKAQSDATFIPQGDIVIRQSTSDLQPHFFGAPTSITYSVGGSTISGDGAVLVDLNGPAVLGGVEYGLVSVEYCIEGVSGGATIDLFEVASNTPVNIVASDGTNRTASGCYSLTVNDSGAQGYDVFWVATGGGTLRISGIQST
ncbi:MAG TPA: hypothetical protein VK917_02355, partial [Ilumatobacter sp.]|nr:hypothetical protein [Ilumatobacter sp.]